MCGIAGIVGLHGAGGPGLEERVVKMTRELTHRGPDDEGYHVEPRAALGHRRLSIIDLEGGRQPIYNEDGSKCIVYNGEVFNYRELKKELTEKGHRFSTNSDTETILHAYEQWGEDCVQRLRGMFAFCVWDSKKRKAFIARDRLGIKPLFYCVHEGSIFFSSEIKSILSAAPFTRGIDQVALASYFMYSFMPAHLTVFEKVRKLLPGHAMTIENGNVEIKKYWDLCFMPDRKKTEEDFVSESMELLRESVRLRMISDVPVGAFLSGGVDSSAVVALMESDDPVKTFTIGFGGNTGGFDDERKYASAVARMYGTAHREHEVSPLLEGLLEKIVGAFDEPFADDSTIPSYHLYELAGREVKVALSGLGGDEAFCGYERYLGLRMWDVYGNVPVFLREKVIRRLIEALPENASGGNGISRLKRFVRASSTDPALMYLSLITKISEKYRHRLFSERDLYRDAMEASKGVFLDYFRSENAEDTLNRAFYCDIKTYLPEDILACTDRLSMRHSLEVRVPFIDHKLIEFSATIPPELKIKRFRKKYLLKKAVSPLLPPAVISHKKQGFVGPLSMWLKTDLKGFADRALSEDKIRRQGVLDPATVRLILEDHWSGRENNETVIWALLIFDAWFAMYMDGKVKET